MAMKAPQRPPLIDTCNACHRATDFAVNVVTVPRTSSFPNQDFSPPAQEP
jgi:hypothetical protein